MSSDNNQSNNNGNKPQEQDPLSQLNQFHQSTNPNQTNLNQTNRQTNQSPNQSEEKPKAIEKVVEKLLTWWGSLKQLSVADKLKEHRKPALIVGGALLACFLILIIGLSLSNSSDDIVNDFQQAMIDEDIAALKDMIVSDQSTLEVDDVFVKKLIDHGKEDDNFLSDIVSMMNAQKSIYDEQESDARYYLNNHDLTTQELLNAGSIYVKQNDSWFGDDYVIGVRPAYIKISTSSEPTELKIDEEKIDLKKGANEQVYGPVLPGKYKIEATKKYPFSVVVDEEEVNLFKKDKRSASVQLDLKGSTVSFKSEIEGTELFINNQSTKQKVGQMVTDFGPVSTNGTMKAYGQLKLPWGTLKSDPVPIQSSYSSINVTPNPFSSTKVKNDMIQVINNYAKEYVAAQVKQDANLFTSIDEESKKKWANDFADKKEYQSKSYYKGQALKTLISVKGATLSQGDRSNVYKVKVPVQFHRRERQYSQFDSGSEPLEEVVKDTYVWLTYNDQSQKWEVTSTDSMFMSGDTFKDSSVITTNF